MRSTFASEHAHARLFAQDPPNRRGDVAGRQPGRGDLIQQRLEDVVVVTIDDRHVAGHAAKPARGRQSGEPAANDDHLGEGWHLLYSRGCMPKPAIAPPESIVQTACPLDCPDACTLNVTVRGGRAIKIDGATENHVTRGYICAKVRQFPQRVYGDDRLLYPAIRRGAKGEGKFTRATWDEALELVGGKMRGRARQWRRRNHPAALLRRLERLSHAGLRRRDPVPAVRHVAAAAHRLRGADRRRQPWPLRQDGVGQLRGLPRREDDHHLGRQSRACRAFT